MGWDPSWVADSCSAGEVIPRLLWIPKVNYLCSRARHWIPSWASWIQPHHNILFFILRFVLTLLSNACLGVPSDFSIQVFLLNVYAFLASYTLLYVWVHVYVCHVPWDFFTLVVFGEENKLWNSLLCNILNSAVSFFPSRHSVLTTLFSSAINFPPPTPHTTRVRV
jgi:hypothetical protein